MKKLGFLILCVLTFGVGFYSWKVSHTGTNLFGGSGEEQGPNSALAPNTLVEIDNYPVTREELDFEYELLTMGIFERDQLTPIPAIPDREDRYQSELEPLKEQILESLIERKLLVKFIEEDKGFDLKDSKRLQSCENDWKTTLENETAAFFKEASNQNFLKTRLCEYSLLNQYLDEKIYAPLKINDDETKAYFDQHKKNWEKPEMALVRQIVLAKEGDAKKVKEKLSKKNFSELAKTYSITPEAEQGGRLKAYPKGFGPTFLDVAFSMKPGQISDIVKSTYGFHILILDELTEQHVPSLAEVKKDIQSMLLDKKKEKEYQKWLNLALHTIKVSMSNAAHINNVPGAQSL